MDLITITTEDMLIAMESITKEMDTITRDTMDSMDIMDIMDSIHTAMDSMDSMETTDISTTLHSRPRVGNYKITLQPLSNLHTFQKLDLLEEDFSKIMFEINSFV